MTKSKLDSKESIEFQLYGYKGIIIKKFQLYENYTPLKKTYERILVEEALLRNS